MRHCAVFLQQQLRNLLLLHAAQCNSNAPSFVRNFKLQLDYVSTSMFEKMHAAPALLALLRLTTFQFHLISKSTKISLTPLKNVCEKSLHMLENHSFYKLDFKRIRHDNETFLVIQHCAMKATYQVKDHHQDKLRWSLMSRLFSPSKLILENKWKIPLRIWGTTSKDPKCIK